MFQGCRSRINNQKLRPEFYPTIAFNRAPDDDTWHGGTQVYLTWLLQSFGEEIITRPINLKILVPLKREDSGDPVIQPYMKWNGPLVPIGDHQHSPFDTLLSDYVKPRSVYPNAWPEKLRNQNWLSASRKGYYEHVYRANSLTEV